MDFNYELGQSLIVELEDECFFGELKRLSKDRSRIELCNVFNFHTNEKIAGNQIFYKSDIKSIKIIKNDLEDESKLSECNAMDSGVHPAIDTDKKEMVLLTANDLKEIETLSKNASYIYKTDRYYHDAIKDMRRQHEIVLNLESCEVGRNNRTTILTIATRQNVYIFDILSLGRIFPELKEILEGGRLKKIIHDSRKVVDNLKYRQDVDVKAIFDTYAAHIGIGGDKNISSLEDCIRKYFNLPENLFLWDKAIDWRERPMDDNRKIITSKKALFTYKLYECLLHDHMLRKFYNTCELWSTVYSNNRDSVEVASDMASNKNSSPDCIEDIDLDFPKIVDTQE